MARDFRFKQFNIAQSRAAMKVGTDGVLLGAWCGLHGDEADILDVGCGTGLISLMAAQRAPKANVSGIDTDSSACLDAMDNAACSPWSDRVEVRETSLQGYAASTSRRFDHIISNPPFFLSSLTAPDPSRREARHAITLPYADLAACSARLLKPDGKLSVILPYKESVLFISVAAKHGLNVFRRTDVAPLPDMRFKRVLLEFRFGVGEASWDTLVIENGAVGYSDHYKSLTRDFYLDF